MSCDYKIRMKLNIHKHFRHLHMLNN